MPKKAEKHCCICGRAESLLNTPLVYMGQDGKTCICAECLASLHINVSETVPGYNFLVEDIRDELTGSHNGNPVDPDIDTHPEAIKAYLDKFVVGQDDAKQALSVAVYNHYKRLKYNETKKPGDVRLDKSNVLFLGPTGCGKTLLAQTIAEYLDVPFSIADATVLTEAGYVGEDVDSIIVRLLQAADYDVKRTERGIIFIDEIDKIARKSSNPSITRDVSGEGVQQGLLKLLEGTVARVPPKGGRKHPEQPLVEVNTKNILFICGGAFEGLEKIVARRLDTGGMGFGADVHRVRNMTLTDLFEKVEPDDLVQFGLMPELIGRLPVYVSLKELDKPTLRRIMQEPDNSVLKQFTKLFELDGIKLTFTNEAIDRIVDETVRRNTGARGLRGVVERVLQPYMFSMPGKNETELTIDADIVEKMSA